MTRPIHSTREHSLRFKDLPTEGSGAPAPAPDACSTHDDPEGP